MSRIILDFNIKPPIGTYNHHAFGAGIVTAFPDGINWIYNNYIIISYYQSGGIFTFDYYMDYIYCQPVFDRQNISEMLLHTVKYDCIELIAHAVINECYVVCCVDEYYIPDREAYGTYHFRHNLLVYGVDTGRKEFYTAGYDETGKFSTQTVPFKTMKAAKPDTYNILGFRKEFPYRIYPEYIERQIGQYNKDIPLDPVGSFPEAGRRIGVDAVDLMLSEICGYAEDGMPIDIRPVSVLYEHRKLMRERMRALYENGPACSAALDEAQAQANKAEVLRNRVYMYNMRQSDKHADALKKAAEELVHCRLPQLN